MAARTAVVAGTATAVVGGVSRHQQTTQKEAAAASQQGQSAATAAPADGTDHRVAQIKQLAELNDRGILTDDEFAAEKAKLLA